MDKKSLENEFLAAKNIRKELEEKDRLLENEKDFLNDRMIEIKKEYGSFDNIKKNNLNESKQMSKLLKQKNKELKNLKKKFILKVFFIIFVTVVFNSIVYNFNSKALQNYSDQYEMEMRKLSSDLITLQSKKDLDTKNQIQGMLSEHVLNPYILTNSNKEGANQYLLNLKRPSLKKIEFVQSEYGDFYIYRNKQELSTYSNIDSGSSVIFPGAIINGASLFCDSYTLIPIHRTGTKLVSNISNSSAIYVENTSYSNINDAINKFISSFKGDFLKSWTYEMNEVKSSEDINKAIGISANIKGSDLGYNFSNNIQRDKTNILVVIRQNYFTISTEPKQSPVEYFDEGSDLSKIGDFEPAYVSDVDYGRMAVLMISADLSKEDLIKNIDSSFKGINVGGGIQKINSKSDISYTLQIIGGGNNKIISNVTGNNEEDEGFFAKIKKIFSGNKDKDYSAKYIQEMTKFIDSGNVDGLVNAVPISYTLKYVNDNSATPCAKIKNQDVILSENMCMLDINLKGILNYDNAEIEIVSNSKDTIVVEPSLISIDDGVADIDNIKVFVNKNSIEPIAIKTAVIKKNQKRIERYQVINISDYYKEEAFEMPIYMGIKWPLQINNIVGAGKLNIKRSDFIDDIE